MSDTSIIVLAVFSISGVGLIFKVIWNKAAEAWFGDSVDNEDGTGYLW